MQIITSKQDAESDWPVRRGVWFLQRMRSSNAPLLVEVLGIPFMVKKGIFSPAFSRSTEFFCRELKKYCYGKSVLEIGCGIGAVGVHCALSGASRVVCTDINPAAIECANENILANRVSGKVKAVLTKDFDGLTEKYDIVFFALPYVYIEDSKKVLEKYGKLALSIFDENYSAQRAFFHHAPLHIEDGGEILVGFSMVGNMDRFIRNLRMESCEEELVAIEKEGRADNRLYKLKCGSG